VIGVVSDIHHRGPDEPARAEFYHAVTQRSFPFINFVVRTAGDPLAIAAPLRGHLAELDPTQPIARVQTMEGHLYRSKAEPRFLATLLGLFAGAALLLCSVGVYATMAYTVTQRRLEIGIRMALGARPATIVGMVVRRGAVLAFAGMAIGLPAALLLSRVLERQLFETSPKDPTAMLGVPILLVIVAVGAATIPAMRGSRVDVVQALRSE
jgi:ABC-type antimicrobial peptide transport system permease subunit